MPLSDSEDNKPPATQGEGYCKCPATVRRLLTQPHAKATVSDKVVDRCTSPNLELGNESASEATTEEDTDSDFNPGEPESEYVGTSEDYSEDSADDGSTEDEYTLNTSEELGALGTDSSGVQRKTHYFSKCATLSDVPSRTGHVRFMF